MVGVLPCGTIHILGRDAYFKPVCFPGASTIVEDGIGDLGIEVRRSRIEPVIQILLWPYCDIYTVLSVVKPKEVAGVFR
jgi:hypothetical protein